MVAFALQLLSREINQLFARVDIVGEISVRLYFKCVGEAKFNQVAHIIAHAHEQKGMSHGNRVIAYSFNHVDRTFVAGFHLIGPVFLQLRFSHGHHVSKVAIIVKSKHQIVVYDGKLCVV